MNIKSKINRNSQLTSYLLIAFVFYAAASLVFAQEMPASSVKPVDEIELSCRLKAKEIAAETYRGCVSELKNAQIEMIKKEYAEKLSGLKAQYENELKKLNSKSRNIEVVPINSQTVSKKSDSSLGAAKTESKKALKNSKALAKVKAPKSEVSRVEITKSKGGIDSLSEMTVQLKPSPAEPASDESILDLPEPTSSNSGEVSDF